MYKTYRKLKEKKKSSAAINQKSYTKHIFYLNAKQKLQYKIPH